MNLAFDVMDKDGNGFLEPADMIGTYDASKHPDVMGGKRTADDVFREFLDTFDVGGEKDGVVTRGEFENYYANLGASIENEDYFELMIRNAWHISGGEGQAANSANQRVLVTNADGTSSVQEVKNDLGLAAGDKKGIVARLRAQGVEAANVELYGGIDATEKPTSSLRDRVNNSTNRKNRVINAKPVSRQTRRYSDPKIAQPASNRGDEQSGLRENYSDAGTYPATHIRTNHRPSAIDQPQKQSTFAPRPPPIPQSHLLQRVNYAAKTKPFVSTSSFEVSGRVSVEESGSKIPPHQVLEEVKNLRIRAVVLTSQSAYEQAIEVYEKALVFLSSLPNENEETKNIQGALDKCKADIRRRDGTTDKKLTRGIGSTVRKLT